MFKRLEQRWERRRGNAAAIPKRIQVTESVTVGRRSSEEVWAFIRPAESAVIIQEDIVRAFTVPGTGAGVGEQQCFIRSARTRGSPYIYGGGRRSGQVFRSHRTQREGNSRHANIG